MVNFKLLVNIKLPVCSFRLNPFFKDGDKRDGNGTVMFTV